MKSLRGKTANLSSGLTPYILAHGAFPTYPMPQSGASFEALAPQMNYGHPPVGQPSMGYMPQPMPQQMPAYPPMPMTMPPIAFPQLPPSSPYTGYYLTSDCVKGVMFALNEVAREAMTRWEKLEAEWSGLVKKEALLESELKRELGNQLLNAVVNPEGAMLDKMMTNIENPDLKEIMQNRGLSGTGLDCVPNLDDLVFSGRAVEQLLKYTKRREILQNELSSIRLELRKNEEAKAAALKDAMDHRHALMAQVDGLPIGLGNSAPESTRTPPWAPQPLPSASAPGSPGAGQVYRSPFN